MNNRTGVCETNQDSSLVIDECNIYSTEDSNCLRCNPGFILYLDYDPRFCIISDIKYKSCVMTENNICKECADNSYMDLNYKCLLRNKSNSFIIFIVVVIIVCCLAFGYRIYFKKCRKPKRRKSQLFQDFLNSD